MAVIATCCLRLLTTHSILPASIWVGHTLTDGGDVKPMQIERGRAWFFRAYKKEQSPKIACFTNQPNRLRKLTEKLVG